MVVCHEWVHPLLEVTSVVAIQESKEEGNLKNSSQARLVVTTHKNTCCTKQQHNQIEVQKH